MPALPTPAEYEKIIARIEQLFHITKASPEAQELEALVEQAVAYEEHHFPIGGPNPHPEIPSGIYCYGPRGLCPHFQSKEVNGVRLPWCALLQKGSVPGSAGSLTAQNVEELIAAWGLDTPSEEELQSAVAHGLYPDIAAARTVRTFRTPPEFDLFLLWDQCKECGLNEGDED